MLGRYRLRRRLGTGAFATVWLAHDERLDREVAVKILPRERVVGGRFEREARAAARLAHPGIVTLYEAAVDDEGAYLVSEYVHGTTLDEAARRRPPVGPRRGADRHRAVRRARPRAYARRDPPRREALQRPGPRASDHPGADRPADRLRGGARGRRRHPHAHRRRDRHGRLHGARAGAGAARRRGGRPVLARARPVRGAERRQSAANRDRGPARASLRHPSAAPAPSAPRAPTRARLERSTSRCARARASAGASRSSGRRWWPRPAAWRDEPGVVAGPSPARARREPATAERESCPDRQARACPDRRARASIPGASLAPACACRGGDRGRDRVARRARAGRISGAAPGRSSACLAGVLVAAIPRSGWLAVIAVTSGSLIVHSHPGEALVLLAAGLVPVVLSPRDGPAWPLAAAAPALAGLGLVTAWPALAGLTHRPTAEPRSPPPAGCGLRYGPRASRRAPRRTTPCTTSSGRSSPRARSSPAGSGRWRRSPFRGPGVGARPALEGVRLSLWAIGLALGTIAAAAPRRTVASAVDRGGAARRVCRRACGACHETIGGTLATPGSGERIPDNVVA